MMRFSIAIEAENDAILQCGRGLSAPVVATLRSLPHFQSVPAVDLYEYGFHLRIAQLVFRIPPIESAQRLVDRIIRCFCLRDQTQRQLMNEPRIGATVPGRINSLFPPLQKSLRVGECAFLFSMAGRGEKENFSLDVLGFQFAALDLGRFAPEICRFDFDHVAHD